MDDKDVIAALSALAQDNRLRVFRLLVEAGPAGLAAGQIGEALGITANTLSFHLSLLKNAGLINARRSGRSLIYSADYDRIKSVIGYLLENCCSRSLQCGGGLTS